MKQECKGRNGAKTLGLWGLAACALLAGCDGAGSGSQEPPTPTQPGERVVVVTVKPTDLVPGSVFEINGRGFPNSLSDVFVNFKSVQDQGLGVAGLPVRITPNLITVVAPTGIPTGLLTVTVRDSNGRKIPLAPKEVSGTPMLTGYQVPNAVRVPGMLEGNQFKLETPALIVYGNNVDATVSVAEIGVLGLDDKEITSVSVTVPADGCGITVPGVEDPQIRGLRIPLPTTLGSGFPVDRVTFVTVRVRRGSLVSNVLQVPAVNSNWTLPSTYDVPLPAFINGCWVSPGVHGDVLELFYSVFQPVVRFKWTPFLEWWNGTEWVPVLPDVLLKPPRTLDFGTSDYQPSFILAGDKNQKQDKGVFSGPGMVYRLLLNIRALWDGTGQGRLRMHLKSEPVSHGEIGVTAIADSLKGNRVEFPYFAVTTALSWPVQGNIVETFSDKSLALDRDTFTNLDPTGTWGDGVARGDTRGTAVAGFGTAALDEGYLKSGSNYLFDTNTGQLYQFPAGATDGFIAGIRAQATDPTAQGLIRLFDGLNPGASRGELHVSRLVVPAGAKIYGRGSRALVIRVSGAAGGLAARIDGDIVADGLDATEGTVDSETGIVRAEAGKGGAGGPGGGKGGAGGVVRVRSIGGDLVVGETNNAQPGEWGGGAGQTIAYTLPEESSSGGSAAPQLKNFVYGGPGGGGGFGTAGGKGRPSNRTLGDNRNNTSGNPWSALGEILRVVGAPGPVRGSEDLLPLIGGSGGGGGGGWLARWGVGPVANQIARLFGVGGGGGGGGGGIIHIVARGSVEIGGRLSSCGGKGSPGRAKPLGVGTSATYGEWAGSCGGGGSGGALLVQVTDALVFKPGSVLDVTGGLGGRPGTTSDPNILNHIGHPIGGDGGRGRVRLEAGRGVNLANNISTSGIAPVIAEDSPATVGPILKTVNGGGGAHGILDLGSFAGAAGNTFYIGVEDGDTPVVYYRDDEGNRVEIIRRIAGLGEFNFTTLTIPEDFKLKGFGSAPLVIRVQGRASVLGTIDAAGADGGWIDIVDNQPIAGAGGTGGPGGGDGGVGGLAVRAAAGDTEWQTTEGEDGRLPRAIAASSGGGYLPGDPWNDLSPYGTVLPAEGGLTFMPALCGGDCASIATHQGGGGGGGGFGTAGTKGVPAPGALFDNGAGGLAYGNNWFLNDETMPFYGGAGGGGGGASTTGAAGTVGYPGSGGGGGGGCLVFAVLGDLYVGPRARINANGGNAFKAVRTGGNGGGGAGGAVFLRVNGKLSIEPGAIITALGGQGNLNPPASYPAQFPASTVNNGGNGALGRIRIEFPGGNIDQGNIEVVDVRPAGTDVSVGTAFQGNEIVSWVWSKPIPLSLGPGDGVFMTDGIVYPSRAVANLLGASFKSPIVRWSLLVDGGEAKCSVRGTADRFFGPMVDFGSINAAGLKPSYMRFLLAFVSSAQTSETVEVDRISIPWEPIDYTEEPNP
ncbi:MAG: hypothetical protein BWX69_00358 [Planctomycetes bacterium ADurb.Bin069]|nr:MAG: hypothetical protein BWX69_00358 [Planctomycetes bacterium ADurb.Bin069]